jgi:hypothetical protein
MALEIESGSGFANTRLKLPETLTPPLATATPTV